MYKINWRRLILFSFDCLHKMLQIFCFIKLMSLLVFSPTTLTLSHLIRQVCFIFVPFCVIAEAESLNIKHRLDKIVNSTSTGYVRVHSHAMDLMLNGQTSPEEISIS